MGAWIMQHLPELFFWSGVCLFGLFGFAIIANIFTPNHLGEKGARYVTMWMNLGTGLMVLGIGMGFFL